MKMYNAWAKTNIIVDNAGVFPIHKSIIALKYWVIQHNSFKSCFAKIPYEANDNYDQIQ